MIKGQGQTKRGAAIDYLEIKEYDDGTEVMVAGLAGSRRPPIHVSQVRWFIFED